MSSDLPPGHERAPTPTSGNFSRDVEVLWRGHHPQRIGPYRIVEVLGSGGMGTVYLAEQTRPVQRRVALKLLDSRWSDSHGAQRFQAECQALARMNHPGIAHFYGAGVTDDGHQFLVLEFVDGRPIIDFCDQARLTIEQRLQLFRRVCEAVQHAHQKAVIHRDLKPGNILVQEVDGELQPKVIDFGIAKGLDAPLSGREGLTQGLLGTPIYLSPEAILAVDDGDEALDTRSDVYSLGMVLYKLLVGVLPLEREQANMVRVIRRIIEQDSPLASDTYGKLEAEDRQRIADRRSTTPSAMDRELRGELDWVLRRAVHRERDRRYGSAAHLGTDIGLYLDAMPVTVGPPTRLYEARKFVRRNRVAVLVAGLALLALTISTLGLGMLYHRSKAAVELAQREADSARAVSGFLVDLFSNADPTQEAGSATARELLDRGAQLIEQEMDAPSTSRADLLMAISQAYINLQQRDKAESLLSEALDILRGIEGEESPRVARALSSLGFLRWTQGREDEAEQLMLRALEIQRAQLGWNSVEVVETLSQLAGLQGQSGRLEDAQRSLEQALELQSVQPDVDLRQRAVNLLRMGSLMGSQGDIFEAQRHYQMAHDLFYDLYGPDHPTLGDTQSGLCITLQRTGDTERAERACTRSLEIRRQHLGEEHVKTSQSQINLATLYNELGRLQEAEDLLRNALETRRHHLSPEHPRTLMVQQLLAESLAQQSSVAKSEEALELLRQLLAAQQRTLPADNAQRQQTLQAYVGLLRSLGRDDEAVEVEGQLLAAAPPVDPVPAENADESGPAVRSSP